MTTQSITSGQSKQLERVAGDAVARACKELGFTKSSAQRALARGNEFSLRIKQALQDLSVDPNMLSIDRSKPFDPVAFIGKGWSIAEQDERSLALPEIDLSQVCFETMLHEGESSIGGEEKLKRLKTSGHIRLDAKVLQTLWENQRLIPESWKKPTNSNTTFIFFDGTVLRDPDGDRCVLCLSWTTVSGTGAMAGSTLTGTSTIRRRVSQVSSEVLNL